MRDSGHKPIELTTAMESRVKRISQQQSPLCVESARSSGAANLFAEGARMRSNFAKGAQSLNGFVC